MSRFTLEEEEQINKLKDFWNSYGNFILTILILVFGSFAAVNGYEWYKGRQSEGAVLAYERTVQASGQQNFDLLTKVRETLFEEYAGSSYAERGALVAAKAFFDDGQVDQAIESLQWLVDHGKLEEYVSPARLTLSSLFAQSEQYDQAIAVLEGKASVGFEGLFSDRLGDVYQLAGKIEQARGAYEKSLEELPEEVGWRAVVERKLAALPQGEAS